MAEIADTTSGDPFESVLSESGPEWLGTTASSKRLGITTRTLYRFIDEGQIPAYRLGRVIRLKLSDIDFQKGRIIVMAEIADTTSGDPFESVLSESGPEWLGTTASSKRLGITTRTLYRFIDEGQIPAYRLGRVIRLKLSDIDGFIESCRIEPGTIGHLYPTAARASDDSASDAG